MNSIAYYHIGFIDAKKASSIQVSANVNAFTNAGIKVTLYTNYTNFKAVPRLEGVKIVNLHMYNESSTDKVLLRFMYSKLLSQSIAGTQEDIIYTRSAETAVIAARQKKRVCFESHNYRVYKAFAPLSFFQLFLLKRHVNSFNFPIKLVVISEALKRYFVGKGFKENRILAYHDGFQSDLFVRTLDKNTYRHLLELPKDKTIIAYTGSLKSDRGIERILRLADTFKELYFVVVGGTFEQTEYYSELSQEKVIVNIKFMGMVSHTDVPKYLFASDILLAFWTWKVPTINYCSPLKLFEYMASGTLVLADGFDTIKEVLTDKHDALLIKPESHEEAVAAIELALQNNFFPDYARNARQKAESHYTWDYRARQIIKFIEN